MSRWQYTWENGGKRMQFQKVAGFLWLLAGLLMIVPPILSEGDKSLIAIGEMFQTALTHSHRF